MILNNAVMIEEIGRKIKSAELILVAGPEKSGKTDLVVELANYATMKEEQEVLFFSLQHEEEILISKDIGRSNVLFDINDTPGISINEVKDKCRVYAQSHRLRTVFIDDFPLMNQLDRGCSRIEEMEKNINALKELAKELNIAIVAVAPLLHYGVCRKPDVSDFREYGFYMEEMVDLILFIWRENWSYEVSVYEPKADVKEKISYRYNDEVGEILAADRKMEEYLQDPSNVERIKEQTKKLLEIDFETGCKQD